MRYEIVQQRPLFVGVVNQLALVESEMKAYFFNDPVLNLLRNLSGKFLIDVFHEWMFPELSS